MAKRRPSYFVKANTLLDYSEEHITHCKPQQKGPYVSFVNNEGPDDTASANIHVYISVYSVCFFVNP